MKGFSLKPARHSHSGEHDLQSSCKAWFDGEHPDLAMLLFAVPNGGKRSMSEGQRLKDEGVVAGVSDMILLLPRGVHNALCLEFKYGRNKQSPKQKEWQSAAESAGARYCIIRDKETFIATINKYLSCG